MKTGQSGQYVHSSSGRTPDEQKRFAVPVAGDISARVKARPNTRLVELRVARGWTQEQVAQAVADLAAAHGKTTGITANTVSRLERGCCSWPYTLVAEFECLFDRPAADLGFVNRRVGRGMSRLQGLGQDVTTRTTAATGALPEARLIGNSSLGADSFEAPGPDIYSPMLAAYGTPQLYILANNEEYRQTFPGITVGTNLLEWAVLNPIAREVLVEWELETELLGSAIRHAAADPRNSEARTILQKCRDESPEFRAICDRGRTDLQRPYSYQLLRDLDSGEIGRVECTIWTAYTNGEKAHFYIGKPTGGAVRA